MICARAARLGKGDASLLSPFINTGRPYPGGGTCTYTFNPALNHRSTSGKSLLGLALNFMPNCMAPMNQAGDIDSLSPMTSAIKYPLVSRSIETENADASKSRLIPNLASILNGVGLVVSPTTKMPSNRKLPRSTNTPGKSKLQGSDLPGSSTGPVPAGAPEVGEASTSALTSARAGD